MFFQILHSFTTIVLGLHIYNTLHKQAYATQFTYPFFSINFNSIYFVISKKKVEKHWHFQIISDLNAFFCHGLGLYFSHNFITLFLFNSIQFNLIQFKTNQFNLIYIYSIIFCSILFYFSSYVSKLCQY